MMAFILDEYNAMCSESFLLIRMCWWQNKWMGESTAGHQGRVIQEAWYDNIWFPEMHVASLSNKLFQMRICRARNVGKKFHGKTKEVWMKYYLIGVELNNCFLINGPEVMGPNTWPS